MKYLIYSILVFSFPFLINGNTNDQYIPLSPGQPITHQYYSLSYNEDNEQANWVYYKLTSDMLIGQAERNSNFRNDPLVLTKSASTKDYTNSGYDRGHLCPAADMKFKEEAMYESFYMSNISPQLPEFNRGIWKELETQVRDWVKGKDCLYIVAGPIFDNTNIRIGANKVKVPVSFYKILYDPAHKQMIAFILPNRGSSLPFKKYTSTVDSIEQITGIDFFSQLPDHIENNLEKEIQLADWFEITPKYLASNKSRTNKILIILLLTFTGSIVILYLRKKMK